MTINENSVIYKRFANKSKMFDEAIEKTNKKINELNELIKNNNSNEIHKKDVENPTANTVSSDPNNNEDKVIEQDKTDKQKTVFSNLKGGRNKTKKKAFKLFAGLRKGAEDKTEEDQQKKDSSQATAIPDSYRVLFGGGKR